MGNLEWIIRTTKIREKDKTASTRKVLQVDLHLWQESQWKDAHKKTMGSCYWYERRVCAEEEVYPLLREEREEVHEFISEQLKKGYIKPLKSPQMALVFFIGKKDEKKHMVWDYRYLNEWIVKNNYSLLLISDIVENIGTKRVFTKIDLR